MSKEYNEYLRDVLTSHKITNEQALLDKHKMKRDEVVKALQQKFGSIMYAPFNSGSYAKNTAVNTKFDFDLIAPFKRGAFKTLETMYNEVHEFLALEYENKAMVKRQKVSIGLEFLNDPDGDVVKIDVVPGRELNMDQYNDDNKLNLYVNDTMGLFQKGSERIQTNVKAQIENIRQKADNASSIRNVIRLLKVWKINNNKSIKSFFIELITIKAFDKNDISGGEWEKLRSVMEFIKDEVETVNLPDPGNSSNNVSETMTIHDKKQLSTDMEFILNRIDEDISWLRYYFNINNKFPKDNGNGFGQKREGVSVPPPTRFA